MPKQFSDGKQTGFTTQEQNWWNRSLGTFSPWSVLQICLQGRLPRQDFYFEEVLSGERTRKQFSSVILLILIQKSWSRGYRDPEIKSFRLVNTERGGGTAGSGSWR